MRRILFSLCFLGLSSVTIASGIESGTVSEPLDASAFNRDASEPIGQGISTGSRPPSTYATDRVIVRFERGVGQSRRAQAVQGIGRAAGRAFDQRGHRIVELDEGVGVEAAIAALSVQADVAHVQPDYLYQQTDTEPDGEIFEQLWGLQNTGQLVTDPTFGESKTLHPSNPGIAGADINAVPAWEILSDCSDVVIAVLDTGINYLHEDFAGNMWQGDSNHGRDFVSGTATPEDPFPVAAVENHGTHVAGTIGASGSNDTGMTGVCREATLMAVRVLDEQGVGSTSSMAQGIDYATANGADVINLSLGGRFDDLVLEQAVADAGANDVLIVAAAGNDGDELTAFDLIPFVPCAFSASHPHVICVASLDQTDELSDVSNFGEHSVNVGAPGRNVLSTWVGEATLMLEDISAWQATTGSEWNIVSCRWALQPGMPELALLTLMNPAEPTPPECTFSEPYLPDSIQRALYEQDATAQGTLDQWLVFDVRMFDLAIGDFLDIAAHSDTGDPFPDLNNWLAEFDASGPATLPVELSLDPVGCATQPCTIGFQLFSDFGTAGLGVAMTDVRIETLQDGSTAHRILKGTSMAAPHVAGVAALVRAFSPKFTAEDTRAAITESGRDVPALASPVTSSGRAVDARAALLWINAPGDPAVEVLSNDNDTNGQD